MFRKIAAFAVVLSLALPVISPVARKIDPVSERAIAEMICAEGGDCPLICRLALAAVVFNRVDLDGYPDDVPGVLADVGAFPKYADSKGFSDVEINEALHIVYAAEYGLDPSFGAVTFSREQLGGTPTLAAGGMFFYCR